MRKFNYVSGILTGLAVAVVAFILVAHKPAGESAMPQSSGRITSINQSTDVYRVSVDNVQYIIVVSDNGGVAITKHR